MKRTTGNPYTRPALGGEAAPADRKGAHATCAKGGAAEDKGSPIGSTGGIPVGARGRSGMPSPGLPARGRPPKALRRLRKAERDLRAKRGWVRTCFRVPAWNKWKCLAERDVRKARAEVRRLTAEWLRAKATLPH